jgi:DNA-binding ferritin-like protein
MDKILNLSAFGDVIHKEDPSGIDHEEDMAQPKMDGTEGKYAYVFKMVLQNVVQTKLLHWQSHFYGQHKALDELFDGLIDKGDELAESVMGKYGRPVLSEEQLCLTLMNYANP